MVECGRKTPGMFGDMMEDIFFLVGKKQLAERPGGGVFEIFFKNSTQNKTARLQNLLC